MKIYLILLSFLTCIVGCSSNNVSKELTPTERIQSITNIINRNSTIPSPIIEANFIEYKKGDGRLGPSDFQFYARIKVKKIEISKWVKSLKEPFNNSGKYTNPKNKLDWWLPLSEFNKLKLYETKKYFNRYNGWLAVDESTGFIYIFTFTV